MLRTTPSRRLAAAILAGLLVAATPAAARAEEEVRDFALADVNPRSATFGKTLALHELLAERGLVLQFTASWCKTCRTEMPEIEKLFSDRRAPIVFVAADEYGHRESILIVAERSGLTAPLLFVPESTVAALEKQYGYEMLPATYFIGSDRKIRGRHQGAISVDRLTAEIEHKLDIRLAP